MLFLQWTPVLLEHEEELSLFIIAGKRSELRQSEQPKSLVKRKFRGNDGVAPKLYYLL